MDDYELPFQIVCAALLKVNGGKPVEMTDAEAGVGFGFSMRAEGDKVTVTVDDNPNEENTTQVLLEF